MGRPRQFDESALLDAAIELFWTDGFDSTSVEGVSSASGVGNGSIYAAYGSKLGLFLAAFRRYCERRADLVHAALHANPGPPRTAVRAFFDAVIVDCLAHPNRRGCLMLNSIGQLGHRVPDVIAIADRTTARMESHVADRLRADIPRKVLDEKELAALSSHIVLVSQGLIQLSRLDVSRQRLDDVAEIACAAIPQ
ncbi:TetR/AcrR family transcriptional regulator [Nocardia amikacinitolerans]|uniref:TetR/AcrR family transcriptional regulator n=1 Tax=Nocardia amikacinitolerans TaxID=756689 RepID=UPI0020A4AD35|nr:TetR/AcrR family transcriptional regulator [Nocardia amikacinitolerans]MCP2288747.1 transcriptional regulator, TetR family [Nocardia amikacinitolerans]